MKNRFWLHTMQNIPAQLTTWALYSQGYTYNPVCIKDRTDILPDYLSRNPEENEKLHIATNIISGLVDSNLLSNKNISSHQDKDEFCEAMKSFLLNGKELLEHC